MNPILMEDLLGYRFLSGITVSPSRRIMANSVSGSTCTSFTILLAQGWRRVTLIWINCTSVSSV